MTLTVADFFCGAGGSSTGAIQVPGIEVVAAANHWQLAVDTHNTNHPDAAHICADLSQYDPRYFPASDIGWFSPECFPAGHLVTTLYGQTPIEDIQLGDLVLTHTGRFMPVVRTQHRVADTVLVRGQGHPGIETTANHSFWARSSSQVWRNEIRQYRREYADAGWIPAAELIDREALWATPVVWDERDAPLRPLPSIFGDNEAPYLLGRWLGDGSVSAGRNTDVTISCSNAEADYLSALLEPLGWHRDQKRTAVNFRIGNKAARDWLLTNCGHGADGKQLPTWVMFWPEELRRSALRGYLDADGGMSQRRTRASTVSRKLAVSIRLLAESLGHRVAMAYDRRETYSIEGRTGHAKRQWIMHWEPELNTTRSPEAFADGIHAWSRVRSVEPARRDVTVYNIEVAEDHSYVLDGIVVKNCTNHSQAKGKKRALRGDAQPDLFGEILPDAAAERSRATMWDVVRFTEHFRYRIVITENVIEAAAWALFDAWIAAMRALGYRHRLVMLNSMHAQLAGPGAAQSRDRMYVVFWREGDAQPDLERLVRPEAVCPQHGLVRAMQAFKRPGNQVGRYRSQYLYRCPRVECRNQPIEPVVRPAEDIIDWTNLGQRIGDRDKALAEKTLARIRAGIERYWRPLLIEAAGNTYDAADPRHPAHGRPDGYMRAWPVDEPVRTVHTTASKALVVPVEGREGKQAQAAGAPLRTMTTRNETGLAFLTQFRDRVRDLDPAREPLNTVVADGANHALVQATPAFIAELRGGGSTARPVADPLATVTASGNHHGLITPAGGTWRARATSTVEPIPARTTRETDGIATGHPGVDLDDVRFRMLEPREIISAMDFPSDYVVLGNRREQVRMAGNAVTPCAARDIFTVVADALT